MYYIHGYRVPNNVFDLYLRDGILLFVVFIQIISRVHKPGYTRSHLPVMTHSLTSD